MLKINGILGFLLLWFGYHFFMTVPSEFREAELILKNQCLTQQAKPVECNCVGATFSKLASADRLEWALRRGTFITYKDFADSRVPSYAKAALAECGFSG